MIIIIIIMIMIIIISCIVICDAVIFQLKHLNIFYCCFYYSPFYVLIIFVVIIKTLNKDKIKFVLIYCSISIRGYRDLRRIFFKYKQNIFQCKSGYCDVTISHIFNILIRISTKKLLSYTIIN